MLTAFGLASIARVTLVSSQVRLSHPMVPLGQFRSRTVVIPNAVGFAFMVGFYGCRSCSACTTSRSAACRLCTPDWPSCR